MSKNTLEMVETEGLSTEVEAVRSTLEDKENEISELWLVVEQAKAETENMRTEL